jgi:translocation and assembly module TamB
VEGCNLKKFLWVCIPLLIGIGVVALVWQFSEKKFSTLIKYELQSLAKTKAGLKLEIEKVKIELLPPSLVIENTSFSPKEEFIAPFTLSKVEMRLDFLSLLGGKIDLSLVHISGLNLSVRLDKIPQNEKKFEEIPIEQVFNFLNLLPISNMILDKSTLILQSTKTKTQFMAQNFSMLAQYNGNILSFVSQAQLQFQNEEKASPTGKTLLRGFANKRDLTIDELSLKTPESDFSFSAEIFNLKKLLTETDGKFNFKIKGTTQEWSPFIGKNLKGALKISGDGKWPKNSGGLASPNLKFDAEVNQVEIAEYKIGDLVTSAQWEKQSLTTNNLIFKHPAGNLKVNDFKLETKEGFPVKGRVQLEKMDLQKLFESLNLKNIPVDLGVQSDLLCEGQLLSDFFIKCNGSVQGTELLVKSDRTAKGNRIVRIDQFSGNGWVTVDKNKVEYETAVQLHESNGNSQGVIDFETGFKIQYQTDNLQLENITELTGLSLKGKAKIKGNTEGNSSYGTIEMMAETQDFWFEKFGLGNVVAPIHYKAGVLTIETERSSFMDTQYLGKIDVNLREMRIKGAFESPILYAENVIQSLSQKLTVPVPANGQGFARVEFEGPFALGGMTYRLDGQINKGSIANEGFDEIKFDIVAKEGNVTVEHNSLRKNKSFIEVNGKANPQGLISIEFVGKNFRLEESAVVTKLFPNLLGNVNFEMNLSNHILAPYVNLQVKASQTIFGDIEIPDSNFKLDLGLDSLLINTQLLGNQIRCEINLPKNQKQTSRLFLEVMNLDFTEYLGLMTENPLRAEYKSNLTMKMDLQSDTNTFLDSSGTIKVEEIKIARGKQVISHSRPLWIRLNKGSVAIDDFLLTGPETYLSIKGKDFTLRDMDFNLSGQLNIKVLQLFLPFFEEFGGGAKGDLQISGSLSAPELYGNINAEDAYFKIKGFPHAFEKLSSQLEFSQKQVILNSIRGTLAGGSLAGDGVIEWRGYKDLFINIKTHVKDTTLLLPDKVRTTGSGDIVFSGSWFPYILSGHYRIYQGLIEMDFAGDNDNKAALKQSIYLPKNIQMAQFEPVKLDLQVVLDQNIEIKNRDLDAYIGGQLQIKGDPRNPILLGNIKTYHGSKLFFRDKPFDILSAFIKFNDPNELNPDLFVTARSRIDAYDVNLMIQGKAQKPQLLLSSQPPLEEQDIISLLALGITSQKLDQDVKSEQQAAQTGLELGTAIISANPLKRQIKESLGVDLKFSSAFDDTKNVAVPKVTVSKDLFANKLKVTGTTSVNDRQTFDVRLQYLLNENVSAVGTYEKTETQDSAQSTGKDSTKTSLFGLDLEYKVEFR